MTISGRRILWILAERSVRKRPSPSPDFCSRPFSLRRTNARTDSRLNFTLLFIAGFRLRRAAAQWTLRHQQKRRDAVVVSLVGRHYRRALAGFYFFCDVKPVKFVAKPLAAAGQNVLLAYLISEMMESVFNLLHLGGWYDSLAEANLAAAIARSAGCAAVILLLTVGLNRIGFRLKL